VTAFISPCHSSRLSSRLRKQRGYVLLTLLLSLSLLVIASAALAPAIAREINREREEELIHRGIQYRRAIHNFAKRTGRFPLTIDELENTNGNRFLRKRYKDPMTGGDFRLLHMSDIAATGSRITPEASADENTNAASPGLSPDSQRADSTTPDAGTAQPASAANAPQPGTTFGGGVIYGVASRSQKKTIREFDHKNHYNQWLFFYSAIYDGSVEANGPTPLHPAFNAQKSPATPANQPASSSPQQQQ
jgi:type II secretory pathway pseudopilin PulG